MFANPRYRKPEKTDVRWIGLGWICWKKETVCNRLQWKKFDHASPSSVLSLWVNAEHVMG